MLSHPEAVMITEVRNASVRMGLSGVVAGFVESGTRASPDYARMHIDTHGIEDYIGFELALLRDVGAIDDVNDLL
jgi:hypothetical protein